MRHWLSILMIGCCAFINAAPLTLDSCLRLAEENNADIRTSKLEVVKAHEVKRQVFTKFFPQVQGSFTAYHALRPMLKITTADIPNESLREVMDELIAAFRTETDPNLDASITGLHHGLSVGVTAFQPICLGGRLINGIQLAQLGVDAAELQEHVSRREALEEIESTYFLVVGLKAKVHTVDTAMSLLRGLEETVRIALEAGVITQSDMIQVQLKKNEMKANQLRLKNGIELATRLLCTQIGIDYIPGMEIDDEVLNIEKNMPLPLGKPGQNHSARPEHELLEMNIRAEQLRKKMTLGEGLPSVVLGGSYSYGNLIMNKRYNTNGFLFVTASVPLTQWWEIGHRLKQHNANIQQAIIKRDNLNAKMTLQEQQAYNNMTEAMALMASDQSAVDLAAENNRIQTLNYTSGLCTMAEMLQANAMLLQAQNALTDRIITYVTARRRYIDLMDGK